MRKKCKVCNAKLSNQRCDFCGTIHNKKKQQVSLEEIANSNNWEVKNSVENMSQPTSMEQIEKQRKKNQIKMRLILRLILLIIGISAFIIVLFVIEDLRFTPSDRADSPLIGTWGGGDGSLIFNQVDSIHFLEDGTAFTTRIDVYDTMFRSYWEAGTAGFFRFNGDIFRYSVSGDSLTIGSRDNRAYYRERRTREFERGTHPEELVGVWHGSDTWIFNADGTGYRESFGDVEWVVVNDELRFLSPLQRWTFSILDDNLSVENPTNNQIQAEFYRVKLDE